MKIVEKYGKSKDTEEHENSSNLLKWERIPTLWSYLDIKICDIDDKNKTIPSVPTNGSVYGVLTDFLEDFAQILESRERAQMALYEA